MTRIFLMAAAGLALSGCSAQEALNFALKNRDLISGGGGTNQYSVYDGDFSRIATDGGIGITATTNTVNVQLPGAGVRPSGVVQYDGIAQVDIAIPGSSNGRLAGELELSTNFGTGAVTGSITEVVDSSGSSYTSNLRINGDLSGQGAYPIDAQLTGTLVDAQQNTWTTDADVAGGFAGPGYEYSAGTIIGTATVDQGGVTSIFGAYVAEAQP